MSGLCPQTHKWYKLMGQRSSGGHRADVAPLVHVCQWRGVAMIYLEHCSRRSPPELGMKTRLWNEAEAHWEGDWWKARVVSLHLRACGRTEVATQKVQVLRYRVEAHLVTRPAAGATLTVTHINTYTNTQSSLLHLL